jgi:hypothetical protein
MFGIGITTRNRPDILDIGLRHFEAFTPDLSNYRFFVHNDSEDPAVLNQYAAVLKKYQFATTNAKVGRLGIAKAKNQCIKALDGCSDLFLFDDDAFPKQIGWADYYAETAKNARVHHLMHLGEAGGHKAIGTFADGSVTGFSGCFGVLLYYTKTAIRVLGGYDPRFGIYGHEHAQISKRAYQAGLSGKIGPYVTPTKTRDFVYSMDLEWNLLKVNAPLIDMNSVAFRSSIADELHKKDEYIQHNTRYFNSSQIYIPV